MDMRGIRYVCLNFILAVATAMTGTSQVMPTQTRAVSCPGTVFVIGNNIGANELRNRFGGNESHFVLANKQQDADAVVDVQVEGQRTVSAILTRKTGELDWSGTKSMADYQGLAAPYAAMMVFADIERSLSQAACFEKPEEKIRKNGVWVPNKRKQKKDKP